MTRRAFRTAALLALCVALPAAAHTGVAAHSHGLESGFVHPFQGLDHLLAMVAVGLWAARAKGRTVLWAPLAFMSGMLLGGAAGIAGLVPPFVEAGVMGSVIALAVMVVIGVSPTRLPALAAIVVFGTFHGIAHGLEMPEGNAAIAYAGGFLAATALLHAIGASLGRLGRVAKTAIRTR